MSHYRAGIEALHGLQHQMAQLEKRIREQVALTPSVQLLKNLSAGGDMLAIIIDRFDTTGQLTSYACVVPNVHASLS
jgi:hypothetical protein